MINYSVPLQGKHVMVTGGGRGIGAAIARQMLQHGAHVSIAGRNQQLLTQTVGQLRQFGEISAFVLDITDPDSVAQGFAAARARFGDIAILVNNAGQATSATFLNTDHSTWQQMLDVNLTGTFNCTQAALPDMVAANWGRIINVVSTAGLKGYAYVSAYCAAKHGVIGMTRALALEVAKKGITVNAICPGYTDTDIVRETIANIVEKTGRSETQALAELTAGNPQKRLIQPQEVANAVAWLCLPGAESMTGQAVAVAGGEVM